MPHALQQVDDVLRGSTALEAQAIRRALPRSLFLIVGFGLFYGAVMGCYGGFTGARLRQPLYSGLKVPLLLLVTFCLSLPSFYVLNLLLGVGGDFAESLRALIASQAGLLTTASYTSARNVSPLRMSACGWSSPEVPEPKHVRYGWAWNPVVNLYNKEGLPAITFRTDE